MVKVTIGDILSYGIVVIVVVGFFFYKGKIDTEVSELKLRNEKAYILQSILAVESSFNEYEFLDFTLASLDEDQISLFSLLRESKFNVLIVTSLEGCNACRDLELERWGLFSRENENISIHILVVDDPNQDKKAQQKLAILGKALSGLPVYFNPHLNMLEEMRLLPEHTPLIFLVSPSGKTIFCYRGHAEFQERSDHLLNLINYQRREGAINDQMSHLASINRFFGGMLGESINGGS